MWHAIQDAFNACASMPLDQLHPASLAQLYQLPLFPSASEFLRYFTLPDSDNLPLGECILNFLSARPA
jgi:hypothetical protein